MPVHKEVKVPKAKEVGHTDNGGGVGTQMPGFASDTARGPRMPTSARGTGPETSPMMKTRGR